MKLLVLLSLLLTISCGQSEDYAQTVSVKEKDTQPEKDNRVTRVVVAGAGGAVAGAALTMTTICILAKVNPKTCARAVPKIMGTDKHWRQLRKLYKEGSLTKEQYKELKKLKWKSDAFEKGPSKYEKAKLAEFLEKNKKS